MATITVYRRDNTLSLALRPDWQPVLLELAEGDRLSETAIGEARFYAGCQVYGVSFDTAITRGWCRVIEEPVACRPPGRP
jgi:hypothetical protein